MVLKYRQKDIHAGGAYCSVLNYEAYESVNKMAAVEGGCVYGRTNVLFSTVVRAYYSLDMRLLLLPDYKTSRKMSKTKEIHSDKIT